MAIRATELRNGGAILIDGEIHIVIDQTHTKPGKGGAFIQAKLKKVGTGQVIEKRFRSAERVETAYLDKKRMQYSYSSEGQHWFMDPDTYEQVAIPEDLIGDAIGYLTSGTECDVMYHEGTPLTVDPPTTVDLEVKSTPPQLKGATATNQSKPATLETGIEVQVPPFISEGETVRIDTRSGEYVESVT